MAQKFATVEEYLDSLPDETRAAVEQLRARVHATLTGLDEVISYNIPTIQRDGRSVVHFAGWKQHVSLYPVPEGDDQLARDLAPYAGGKGTVRFPLSEPLPLDLVARIVTALDVRPPR